MSRWTRLSALAPIAAKGHLPHLTSLLISRVGLGAFGLLYCCLLSIASAADVTLAWDPVSAADLAGYRIHYGPASGQYNTHIDVKNVTTTALSDLVQYK